jgi:predicted flap endonuclease-1-like 5' DNA nuclease
MQRAQFPLTADGVNASATDENVEEELSSSAPRTTPLTNAPPLNFPVEPPPALPPARLHWINDAKLTARSKEYPDDLSKIKGIGDVYKQRLYRAGFHTWKQIAEADTETLRRATSAYPSSNVEEWLVQAERLMEKHGRKSAVYNGPPPDDMTKILGIGPVGAAVLYRAGICTYEQLATTPIAELEALFPIAVAGDQPDFAQWVARATTLADEKHGDKK